MGSFCLLKWVTRVRCWNLHLLDNDNNDAARSKRRLEQHSVGLCNEELMSGSHGDISLLHSHTNWNSKLALRRPVHTALSLS